jgi:clan AA aspartic protease (TIGR02281 family)
MLHYAKLLRATSLMLVVAIAGAAAAGPFEDGEAAYQRSDYATALRLLRPLADQGLAVAQFYLGVMYRAGLGVAQNYPEAVDWYRKAADHGSADAQSSLGLMHEKGLGVPQNYAEAVKWYRLAAAHGNALGQNNLGVMYAHGKSVPQNHAEAVKWYRLAAAQGYDIAQYNIGAMYRDGLGGLQDYAEAFKWFHLAAAQHQADAQNELGWMYANGHGVPQNYVRAYTWYNLSAAQGNQRARSNRDQLSLLMTPAQIAEAQNPTNEYAPSAAPNRNFSTRGKVPLKKVGGTFVVPVEINGAITLGFTIDSGAADVSVPADVFSTLTRTGTIRDTDIIGEQTYILADGSKSQSVTFTIKPLKVGDRVVENVRGSVAPSRGSLLLGQSFLERFKSWSIDNAKHVLLLEPQ